MKAALPRPFFSLLVALQLATLFVSGGLAFQNPPPQPELKGRLSALLPTAGIIAQVLETQPGISVVELQQRVSQGGGDLKILASVVGQIQNGNIPIYDERLGISRAEFQRFLIFRNTLEPSGRTVRLSLLRDGSRLAFTDGQGSASTLKGLVIDLNSGELTTAEGFSARPRSVQMIAAQDSSGLGISGGFAWDVKGSNPRTQNALQGHLSLLQVSGGVLLSYNRVVIQKGRVSEDTLNLMYKK
ncbi:hypothetical protein [Deinococcus ruber]|uniref:Uncharacterized protein n=1 Tax=Deinococcus ruber TaxID=1848197 RepID=A0A918F2X5_9DEIO|nr:hypothetical protein [Deinococcus ruber]GGQ96216.1 hypothetical protein GCM10008957_05550 [Deinococcus ruber]